MLCGFSRLRQISILFHTPYRKHKNCVAYVFVTLTYRYGVCNVVVYLHICTKYVICEYLELTPPERFFNAVCTDVHYTHGNNINTLCVKKKN